MMIICQLLKSLWRKQQKCCRSHSHLCFEEQYVKCSFKPFASSSTYSVKWLRGYITEPLCIYMRFPLGVACFSVCESRDEKCMSQWCFCLLQQSLLIMNHTSQGLFGYCLPAQHRVFIHRIVTQILSCLTVRIWLRLGNVFLGVAVFEDMSTWQATCGKLFSLGWLSWDRWIGHGVCCWHLLAVHCLARSSKLLGTSGQGIPARQEAILFL